MKIILSQDFKLDGARKDSSLTMSKYFLAKSNGDFSFTGWNDLVSDSTISKFGTNSRTSELVIEGLWEEDKNKTLKLHIELSEANAYNLNGEPMGFNIGYFYYINFKSEEKIAFVLLPDDLKKDNYGMYVTRENYNLGIVLGSNMLNIDLGVFEAKIKCQGELEDTEFLEGHGMIRGINLWTSPEDESRLIYKSSSKSYLLDGTRKEWFGADLYPSPEGFVGENPTYIKVPTSISLSNQLPDLVINGLGGVVKLEGEWGWDEYSVISTGTEFIGSGVSSISSLREGEIIISEDSEGMIDSVDWETKTIRVNACPQVDTLRTAGISLRSLSAISPVTTIEQENSTSVWELNIPIQGYDMEDRPIVRLDWATLRGITGRTNKEFTIVTEKGQEPKEGNWIRVDCDWTGWQEYIGVVIDKINHLDLWWDIKITLSPVFDKIIETLPDTPPICYIVLGGSEVREFVIEFPESLFPGMPKPTYLKRTSLGENIEELISPSENIEKELWFSGSELMEIDEVEIFPEDSEIDIFLHSPQDSIVTISLPDNSPVDIKFTHSESHGLKIPSVGEIKLPMKIEMSEEELNEDLTGKVTVTTKEGESKSLQLVIKKGRKKKKGKKSSTSKSSLIKTSQLETIYFHSTGSCLSGLWNWGSENIINPSFSPDGIDLEKTTLRVKIGDNGFEPISEYGWIKKGEGMVILLAKIPQNSSGEIIGKDIEGIIDLWSWEKQKSIWSAKFIQGYSKIEIFPSSNQPLELSGAKNSIFPYRRWWTMSPKNIEVTREGVLEEFPVEDVLIDNVVWGKGSEYLKPGAEVKIMNEGGEIILQPLFNVQPKYYSEEFNIQLQGNYTMKLLGNNLSNPIPFDLWIKKPKLDE